MPVNTFQDKDDELKQILRCLLIARGQELVTVRNLARDYLDETEEKVPYKRFGYSTFIDYLRSIPDCVRVTESGNDVYVRHVDSPKSQHISNLVARQNHQTKRSKSSSRNRKRYAASKYYPNGSCAQNRIPVELLGSVVQQVNTHHKLSKSYILEYVNERVPELYITMDDLDRQLSVVDHQLRVDGNYVVSKSSRNSCQRTAKEENHHVPPNLSPFPRNYSLYIPKKQKTIKHQRAPGDVIDSNGCQEKYIEKCNNKENCGNNKSNGNRVENNSSLTDQDIPSNLISPGLKGNLIKLIRKYADGIWAADLPDLYLKEFSTKLNYEDLGFSNVIELVNILPAIFHCTVHTESKKLLLLNAQQPLSDLTKKQNKGISDMSKKKPSQLSSKVSGKHTSPDVMGCEETVEQIGVTDLNITLGGYDEIIVSEVFSPSLFWIQLYKKQQALEQLMIDLNNFYENVNAKYKIPRAELQIGLNVACVYGELWHRAMIKNIKSDDSTTVMFYDYGTVKTYNIAELYFLDHAFSYLPAQAIPCGLYNVKPCKSLKWSDEVIMKFAKKVMNIPLMVTVSSVDLENNSMMVSLTDTRKDDDVHINDWLVHNNFAELGQIASIRPNNFPHRCYLESLKKKGRDPLRVWENMRSKPTVQLSKVEEPALPTQKLNFHVKVVEDRKSDKSSDELSKTSSSSQEVSRPNTTRNGNGPNESSRLLSRVKSLVNKRASSNNRSFNDLNNSSKSSDTQSEKSTNVGVHLQNIHYNSGSEPLHFRSPLNPEETPDFDTFRSVNGGHGRMEPMDWSAIDDPPEAQSNPPDKNENNEPTPSMDNWTLVNGDEPEPNSCFVNFANNTVPTDGISWAPDGNIVTSRRNSTLLLRKMDAIKNVQSLKLAVSKPVLTMFQKEMQEDKFSVEYEKQKDTQCQELTSKPLVNGYKSPEESLVESNKSCKIDEASNKNSDDFSKRLEYGSEEYLKERKKLFVDNDDEIFNFHPDNSKVNTFNGDRNDVKKIDETSNKNSDDFSKDLEYGSEEYLKERKKLFVDNDDELFNFHTDNSKVNTFNGDRNDKKKDNFTYRKKQFVGDTDGSRNKCDNSRDGSKRNMTILYQMLKNFSSNDSDLDSDDLSKCPPSEPMMKEVSTRFFAKPTAMENTSDEDIYNSTQEGIKSPISETFCPVFNDIDLQTDDSEWDYCAFGRFSPSENNVEPISKHMISPHRSSVRIREVHDRKDESNVLGGCSGQDSSSIDTSENTYSSSVNASISSNLESEEESRKSSSKNRKSFDYDYSRPNNDSTTDPGSTSLSNEGSSVEKNTTARKLDVTSILRAARQSAYH